MDETAWEIERASRAFVKGREPLKKAKEELRKAMDANAAKGVTQEELKALQDSCLKLWLIEQKVDIDLNAYAASTMELAARQKARKA
jgi:hypothetical protein